MKVFFKKFLLITIFLLGTSSNFLRAAQEAVIDVPTSWYSKCMLGAATLAAATAGVRYWWVSSNADRIEKAMELTTQPRWVHNFKKAQNLQENAQKLIVYLSEDWNGIKALSATADSKFLPKNIEEIIKILEEHLEQLNLRVREIEKIVGDAELSAQDKTLAQRRERVEFLLNEENEEPRDWMPWLKNWAYSWAKKPNKKRALECLEKLYVALVDAENLLDGIKKERARFYITYPAYEKTVTLLAKIKEQQENISDITQERIETVKGIWHADLEEIHQVVESQALQNKITLIHQNIDTKAKFENVVPCVEIGVIDLLTTIQRNIIASETTQAPQRPRSEERKRRYSDDNSNLDTQ